MNEQNLTKGGVLRIAGAFISVFSLVVGLLCLLVIPSACSFVGSLQLLMLGFLFVVGVLTFFLGQALVWKKRAETKLKGGLKDNR